MSVEDLESAISRLSAEELGRFSEWFEGFMVRCHYKVPLTETGGATSS
jgi:hypothetical protein